MKNTRLLIFFVAFLNLCTLSQPSFDPSKLAIKWELITNNYEQHYQNLASLDLQNTSKAEFPGLGWSVYFNYNREIYLNTIKGDVSITHVNGDVYRMSPIPSFPALKKGESHRITFVSEGAIITYTSAPCGFYLVWDNQPLEGIPISRYQQLPIIDSTVGLITPEQVFEKNSTIRKSAAETLVGILPTPVSYEVSDGIFILDKSVAIETDPLFQGEAEHFAMFIQNLTGFKPDIRPFSAGGKKIILQTDSMPEEGYRLQVNSGEVVISAGSASGAFYGIQSLKAMLPVSAWEGVHTSLEIPAVRVTDFPRFKSRSLLLDVARNFQKKEEIFKVLDVMAFYKLNVLHLHLTDDEGWRLEIPSLPELTEIGSKRGHTTDSREILPPSYGAGPVPGATLASGCYSRNDFIELLRYATNRHIMIIPEIESPGHSRAAIKSMDARYEKYLELGDRIEAERYLLRDPDDKSAYISAQRWTDNVMCVAMPSVYTFIAKILDDLILMYREAGAPLETIHIGGDEVPEGAWERSPLSQKLIAFDPNVQATDDLWYYYFRKIDSIFRERNLTLSGWEEIGMRKTKLDGAKHFIPNPDFADDNFRIHVWNNGIGWGSEDLPYRLANAGYKVMLSCVSNLYFDLAYEKSSEEPGYYWGGFQDTDKPYYFIPFNYYRNTREDSDGNPISPFLFTGKDRLTDYGKSNILGIQGLLWGENVRSTEMLEYLLLPKMLALAERAWAKDPVWVQEKDSIKNNQLYNEAWSEFANRLGMRELPRLDHLNGGYRYRIPSVGIHKARGYAEANCQFPGMIIRFTTDGSDPQKGSPVYIQPVKISGTIKFAAFNSDGRRGRVSSVTP